MYVAERTVWCKAKNMSAKSHDVPTYLSELIEEYHPTRTLRSSSQKLLKKKVVKFEKLGKKSFAFSAPEVWNSLPFYLRNEPSLGVFKKNLKTLYFREAFY